MRKYFMIGVIFVVLLTGCSSDEVSDSESKIMELNREIESLKSIILSLESKESTKWMGSFKSVEELNPETESSVFIYSFKVFQSEKYLYFHSKENLDINFDQSYVVEYDEEFNIINLSEQ